MEITIIFGSWAPSIGTTIVAWACLWAGVSALGYFALVEMNEGK